MAYSAVSVHRAVDVVMKGKLHLKKNGGSSSEVQYG